MQRLAVAPAVFINAIGGVFWLLPTTDACSELRRAQAAFCGLLRFGALLRVGQGFTFLLRHKYPRFCHGQYAVVSI